MTTLPNVPARRTSALPVLAQLTLGELRRLLRSPMFTVGAIGFPVMFFALFGLPAVQEYGATDPHVGPVILTQFAAYSLLSLALFSFGAAVATERSGAGCGCCAPRLCRCRCTS
ncbi:hypothetical protein MSS93_14830 [Deinococcus radiodurans]|nr:hypothetical protein MSS93_14830 [Deinococcus radiodurans]